jgi:hypothetical protein
MTTQMGWSQSRSCDSDAIMEQLLQDPEYYEAHQQKLARAESMAQNQIDFREDCTNTIVLPIAIHFQGISNPDRACLEALAANQIETVNQDFQGMNSDIVNWDNVQNNFFPGISNGDGCVEFCIPTMNHPSGFGLSDGDPAVTINQFSGDFSGAWSGYINVFVRNINALGYSPLGGNGNGDGVTVDIQAFGTTPSCGQVSPGAPFNLGRTLTHELGHYFLLYHIWRNDGCGIDDQVSDTPLADDEYFGCPSVGQSSCGSTDMHMNYMDYTNDMCMYMFSAGQMTRMENYILANLSNVMDNADNVCTASVPTCDDGIQNGDEEGVDCGGSSCPPCEAEPTCDDGIQNGDEEGVDCGGSFCPPCSGECNNDLVLTLELDLSPWQTSWEITDAQGNILYSGGPYSANQANTTIIENICLPDGCFTFTMFDTGGNGLCCRTGEGSYVLTGPNGVIAEGARFAAFISTDFCLEGGGNGPTCDDGIQNGDEEGIDCGGSFCPPCEVEPTCDDGIQNGDEEGVDCGGSFCPPCEVEPTCDDGIQNGDEEGVDCGGSFCPPCEVEPTCDDGIQNGDEEGVDCGGSFCPPCEEPSCDAPTGDIVTFFANPRLVQISWNPVSGATQYEIRYRIVGTGSWSTRIITSTSTILNRLQLGTDYEYEIRALCASGWSNATSGSFTTNTPREGTIAEATAVDILNLYPNPVRSEMTVELYAEDITDVKISIIDVLGRKVYVNHFDLFAGVNTIKIDVNQLMDGYHLLRIEKENTVNIKRFIKD